MLTLKYLMRSGEKVGLNQLAKIFTAGIQELDSHQEKKQFGLDVMKIYDYENDEEMNEYLKHGESSKYFSNLIYEDDTILMKNIVWNPQAETPIHGHSCQGCWVLCLEGELVENIYENKEGDASMIKSNTVTPGGICYMHDNIGFHTIGNPSSITPAVTLHCYHPPYESTSVLNEEGKIDIMA